MAVVMAKLEVDDYDAWKSGTFDRDPAGRNSSAKGHRIFRDTEGSNELIVAVEFDTSAAAREFRERLKASGALDQVQLADPPRIYNEVEALAY
jgi:hypothetical protein